MVRFVSDGTIEANSEHRNEIEKCWADPHKMTPIPTYQVMDYDGKILNPNEVPQDVRNYLLRLRALGPQYCRSVLNHLSDRVIVR